MKKRARILAGLCAAALLAPCVPASATQTHTAETDSNIVEEKNEASVRQLYEAYSARFASVTTRKEIQEKGFSVVESQIFPFEPETEPAPDEAQEDGTDADAVPDAEPGAQTASGMVVIPAFDRTYGRLALFLVDADGNVLYKTDQLAANSRVLGQMEQPKQEIASIAFQDLNGDGLTDITLITACDYEEGSGTRKHKVGDVLFQNPAASDSGAPDFYRDYRISDKINRFGMNKNAKAIRAFVRDGYSTEFLYTAATLRELQQHGFQIIAEQCYTRTFGKLGRLQVVPGTYHIADYNVFLIYLVDEQGGIQSAIQPMGDYDSLYALMGINCRDIDGDGLKDIVVLARYSYEDEAHGLAVATDYSIYYQRTGGFSADTEIKSQYQCSEEDTMQTLVEQARAYWGWRTDDD